MNWDAADPFHTFQYFCGLEELWMKDQNSPYADQYIKIMYFPGLKVLEISLVG